MGPPGESDVAEEPTGNSPRCRVMMSHLGIKLSFLAAAFVALVAYVLTFELRYMWYLNSSEATFIRITYAVSIVAIVALWVFLPWRLIVAIVALLGFVVPPLYNDTSFAKMDWRFAGFCLISISLLVLATHLRR